MSLSNTTRARLQGRVARFCNKPIEDNPYGESQLMFAWLFGWYQVDEEMKEEAR